MDHFMLTDSAIVRVFDIQDDGEYKTAQLAHYFGDDRLTLPLGKRAIYPSNFVNLIAFNSIDVMFCNAICNEIQVIIGLTLMNIAAYRAIIRISRILSFMKRYYGVQ